MRNNLTIALLACSPEWGGRALTFLGESQQNIYLCLSLLLQTQGKKVHINKNALESDV